MCRCGEPLVSTFAFSKKEFICVRCGSLYELLQPQGADETPELLARMEELRAEWEPIGAALLGGGLMLTSCAECSRTGEPHLDHATAAEVAAHEAALARVREIQAGGV